MKIIVISQLINNRKQRQRRNGSKSVASKCGNIGKWQSGKIMYHAKRHHESEEWRRGGGESGGGEWRRKRQA
jgi:hypothetical protein